MNLELYLRSVNPSRNQVEVLFPRDIIKLKGCDFFQFNISHFSLGKFEIILNDMGR